MYSATSKATLKQTTFNASVNVMYLAGPIGYGLGHHPQYPDSGLENPSLQLFHARVCKPLCGSEWGAG